MSHPPSPRSAGIAAFVRARVGRALSTDATEDGGLTALLFLASLLLAWDAALVYAPSPLVGLLFLLGPFAGAGAGVALLAGVERDLTTFLFVALVDGLLVTTAVASVARYSPLLPFTTVGLAVGFNAAYLLILAALWTLRRDRLTAVPAPAVDRRVLGFAAACLAVLAAALVGFQTRAATAVATPNVLLYLWLLAVFALVFVRYPADVRVQALFLATAGLAMVWSQALSSQGLVAVDGLETTRFARARVYDLHVAVTNRRLYESITAATLIPGLSALTTWTPFRVGKYVVPTVVGLSLPGVYRLSRTWIGDREAFAVSFLLLFQWPFLVELGTNYRSAFAFPVLVACYFFLLRRWDRLGVAVTVAYLLAVLLLHDTVGVFATVVLAMTAVLAALARWAPMCVWWRPSPPAVSLRRVVGVFALSLGGLLGFYFFNNDGTFAEFASRGVVLVALVALGIALRLGSRRSAEATVGNLNETLVDLARQGAIVAEIGLMALGTAILMAGWVFRDRLTDRLDWHETDRFHEVLLVANAAWFGAMVILPLLGSTRVFLYASPLLVALLPFAVRQLDPLSRWLRGGTDRLFGGLSVSAGLLLAIVTVGFLAQSGLAGVAMGTTVSHPSLGQADNPEVRHFTAQDAAANEWTLGRLTGHDTVYVDEQGWALLVDDPGVPYHALQRMSDHDTLAGMLDEGCVFLRAVNGDTGRFHVKWGQTTQTVVTEYDLAALEDHSTVYAGGSARVVC